MVPVAVELGRQRTQRSTLHSPLLVLAIHFSCSMGSCAAYKVSGGDQTDGAHIAAENNYSAVAEVEATMRADLERRIEALERDLARETQESRAQSKRAESLQQQLEIDRGGQEGYRAGTAADTPDVVALKSRITQLVERLRVEKTQRLKAERETQAVARKVLLHLHKRLHQVALNPCQQNGCCHRPANAPR